MQAGNPESCKLLQVLVGCSIAMPPAAASKDGLWLCQTLSVRRPQPAAYPWRPASASASAVATAMRCCRRIAEAFSAAPRAVSPRAVATAANTHLPCSSAHKSPVAQDCVQSGGMEEATECITVGSEGGWFSSFIQGAGLQHHSERPTKQPRGNFINVTNN